MIQLPHGCRCSDLKVKPANWATVRASCRTNWYIYYRFYDPEHQENPKYRKGKLVIVKGMNVVKNLAERQECTRQLMADELDQLQRLGYNPITGNFLPPNDSAITDPHTPLLEALNLAFEHKTWEHNTRQDVQSTLKGISAAAKELRLHLIPVCEIRRKHLVAILNQTGKAKGGWSHTNFNKHRAYLHSLFKQLLKEEAVEGNPVTDIERMKGVRKLRTVLTDTERELVVNHLRTNYPEFHRFVQIFFHSGTRRTEIMKVKVSDVDLKRQVFKVLVKKGKDAREVEKVIKDVALPYWEELLEGASPEDYIFSEQLKPGPNAIRPDQVTRRWEVHVKEKLGIAADLYSLKHLNTDETAARVGIEGAAMQNSHTSTIITLKHYAINEASRQNEKLKRVRNIL